MTASRNIIKQNHKTETKNQIHIHILDTWKKFTKLNIYFATIKHTNEYKHKTKKKRN